jgi:hypothetical protein
VYGFGRELGLYEERSQIAIVAQSKGSSLQDREGYTKTDEVGLLIGRSDESEMSLVEDWSK